jgi:hypothetical protein
MNFNQNPFVLLELTPTDNKAVIAEQFEEKMYDGEIDEHDLLIAQKNLMTSKTRLKAELSWLINVNSSKANEIATFIRDKNYHALKDIISTLDGLSKANIASFLCTEKQATKQHIDYLFKSQQEFTISTILKHINANRTIAGFPLVEQSLISELFPAITATHAEAVLVYISSTKHPGKVFTQIVEKYIKIKEIKSFIDEVGEKYYAWILPGLKLYEDVIVNLGKKIKLGDSNKKFIEKIISKLEDWQEYSLPLQLIYHAKGLDKKSAKDLYHDMRDVYLWLANEKKSYQLALKLAQALGRIFAKLPSVAAQNKKDIQTLEDLIKNKKEDIFFNILTPIIKAISIIPYLGFIVAHILIWGARKFGPMKTIIGFTVIVLSLIILSYTDLSRDTNLNKTSRSYSSGYSNSSSSYSNSYDPSYNDNSNNLYTTAKNQIETKPLVGKNHKLSKEEIRYCQFQEKRLDYIKNQFPENEYRNNTIKSANAMLLTNEIILKYNALVADYNSRCSSYRYRESDLNAVKKELLEKKAELELDAQKIMKTWNTNFRFQEN